VSDYVNHEFGYVGSRNITIYPGSDLSTFSKRNSFDIPDNCIGMVYRLEGDKLNEHSIDVFIKVIQRRTNTRALIVGGGTFLELYKNKVEQAGVINSFTFTGYTSYELLPALYEQMSLFVAPVHTESFGQVTPFAMGMQIPVVGYDVGALKEIIGDSQLLAPPGDSDALASIIIDLLDDRERRLQIGINNRQRVQKLFSVEAMIDSYSKLYEEMLKLPKVVS
jgi:glycosyltransferase involved in cell wall biosynthesis